MPLSVLSSLSTPSVSRIWPQIPHARPGNTDCCVKVWWKWKSQTPPILPGAFHLHPKHLFPSVAAVDKGKPRQLFNSTLSFLGAPHAQL